MMQTKRFEAAAIAFLHASGRRHLDERAIGGGFIGAVDIQIQIARGVQIQFSMPAARIFSDV